MPKGYWIVQVDIHDMDSYQAYVAANAKPFEKYGAKFLVRGGRFENTEGSSRSRHVVVEFADYQTALDCWHSPEYQHAITLRAPASDLDMVIIEGYDD